MVPSSSELIDAVSNPTRRRILRTFVDSEEGCASTEDLATLLEQPISKVGYHLKTLARAEILRFNRDSERNAAGGSHHSWSLSIEPDWLRVVLDVWVESTG